MDTIWTGNDLAGRAVWRVLWACGCWSRHYRTRAAAERRMARGPVCHHWPSLKAAPATCVRLVEALAGGVVSKERGA